MSTPVLRPPLVRSADRVIAGVCAGLAMHLGWPVRYIRIGMVVATLAGGAGLVFYAWLWIMVPTADESAKRNARRPASPIAPAVSGPLPAQPTWSSSNQGWPPGPTGAPVHPGSSDASAFTWQGPAGEGVFTDPSWQSGLPAVPASASAQSVPGMVRPINGDGQAWFRFRRMPYAKEILLGIGLLLAGAILIARLLGVDVPLGTLIPAAAILGGASIAWMQLDETRRAGIVDKAKANQAGGWVRLAAGLALVVAGVLVMVSGSGSWEQTWLALLASVAVLGGVAVVLLPWGLKFWRDLETERAGRVRATERAEIAAHLHDSVLQTLALIQRRAGNEHDVVR
jgi:phage shock protein PspC (stress-responsive transcriptional regulator)